MHINHEDLCKFCTNHDCAMRGNDVILCPKLINDCQHFGRRRNYYTCFKSMENEICEGCKDYIKGDKIRNPLIVCGEGWD